VEWRLAGETKVLGENLPQRHYVHHKSHKTWNRTRAAAVGSQRLTAWATARPRILLTRIVINAFFSLARTSFHTSLTYSASHSFISGFFLG
jgi:hypothetical protein